MEQQSPRERIPGWGWDADPQRRPGVPREERPHRRAGAHWEEPPKQRTDREVLKRKSLDELTPVFGDEHPPSGMSGMVRRLAYQVPEYRRKHWLLLLLADRIDVLEHRIRRNPQAVGLAAFALVAAGFTARGFLR